jgi:hypothetical protein
VIFRKTILLLFVFASCYHALAQVTSNRHNKKILVTSDSVTLDTLSIIPGTVLIQNNNGNIIDTSGYTLDYAKGILIFKQKTIEEIYISYQTFPYLFTKENKHKELAAIRPNLFNEGDPFSVFNYQIESNNNDIFKTEGLDKSGSISRGISFGNSQDLVVNSNLNLQLSGKLSNDVEILLAATDSNIPLQPNGNTQQLQDFDKVFIQLSKDKTKLIAGDFQLLRPNSYFMNFNKKAQGLSFSTSQNLNSKNAAKPITYNTTLSGAVSRGKFARNKILGVEANQGPYRLYGAENETFIVVLSGTEKVYIDGRLLTRGQEHDYIIDYNTAEITFTAKQLITKDKRIVVEFQYSDKNYARSLVHIGNDFETTKLKVRTNIYSEQDSKNQPLKQDLSDDQKQLLSQIGDTLSSAVSKSYDSVAFSNNEVLYKKTDTIIGTKVYSIFVYSTNPDSAYYRATFSNVGEGNGNYVQTLSSANGKVYQWVAPDATTGKPNGSFEPVVQLITPKQKQMFTVGVDYDLTKNTKLSVETALTNNDLNTFSSVDSKDDLGYGVKTNIDNIKPLKSDSAGVDLSFNTNINYEYVQKYFSPIERYRSVEFERDWNRANADILNDQHIIGADWKLVKTNKGEAGYRINNFIENNNYNGVKHSSNIGWNNNGFKLNYDGSLLNSKSTTNTIFYRHLSGVSQTIKKAVVVGFKDYFEQNKFSLTKKDSLLANSYQFWEWQGYAENADTTNNRYGVKYIQRTDYLTKLSSLSKATFGESYGAFLELNKNPNSILKANTTYRTLKIMDTTITTQKPDNTLLSRLEYNFRLWKGLIFSGSFYEIGSGLEVKKNYVFIEVAAGQGVYTWNDYNNNDVKELNEFEVAVLPGTASYIKVFTPTNEYIKIFNNQFSQQLMVKPAALWGNKKGIRKFVARFANQTTYRVDRKTTDPDYKKAYNPFLPESETINNSVTLNSSFRNTFFINQLSPVFGLDFTYQNIKNVALLVNGIDTRQNTFNETRLRWNMTKQFHWDVLYKNGRKGFKSEFFDARNYTIMYYETEPQLSYQPNTAFRVTLSYKYTNKTNAPLYGKQQSMLQNYGVDIKYNILQTGSLNAKANLIEVVYNDVQNSALAFEMLDAFQIGQNITWGVNYQRNLSNNMQVSITYDGRKSETSKAIHIGGAQVRAYF